ECAHAPESFNGSIELRAGVHGRHLGPDARSTSRYNRKRETSVLTHKLACFFLAVWSIIEACRIVPQRALPFVPRIDVPWLN
ncbi:MAG: hypothetical protein ACRDUW_27890, partial [Pseudonocardiaceae bacterium]